MKKILSLLLLTSALSELSFGVGAGDDPRKNIFKDIHAGKALKSKAQQKPLADKPISADEKARQAFLMRFAAFRGSELDSDSEDEDGKWDPDNDASTAAPYRSASRSPSPNSLDGGMSSLALTAPRMVNHYGEQGVTSSAVGVGGDMSSLALTAPRMVNHYGEQGVTSSAVGVGGDMSSLNLVGSQREDTDVSWLDLAEEIGLEIPDIRHVQDTLTSHMIELVNAAGVDSKKVWARIKKAADISLKALQEEYRLLHKVLIEGIAKKKAASSSALTSVAVAAPPTYCGPLDDVSSGPVYVGLANQGAYAPFNAYRFDPQIAKEIVNRGIEDRIGAKEILSRIFSVDPKMPDAAFRNVVSYNVQQLVDAGKINVRVMAAVLDKWKDGVQTDQDTVHQLQRAFDAPAHGLASMSSTASGAVARHLSPVSGLGSDGSSFSRPALPVGSGLGSASSSRSGSPILASVSVTENEVKKVLMDMGCNLRTVRNDLLYSTLAVERPEIVTSESARDLLLRHILDNGGLRSPQAGILKYLSS